MNRGTAHFLLLATFIFLNGCGGGSDGTPSSPSASIATAPTQAVDSSLTAPTPEMPEIGQVGEEIQPLLTIGNSTGGSGARTYTFEVATDNNFQQVVATESGLQEGLGGITNWKVVEQLQPDTQYLWRARASSDGGPGPFSTKADFRIRAAFTRNRASGGLVVFDPLTNGGSVGTAMGGEFVADGWQSQSNSDCIRYQIPVLPEGRIEFETRNVSSPNPVPGKRMLISMWNPEKGDYTTNPFRMHLQKLDKTTAKFNDVRLRWISRTQETNTGISFYDFEPEINYSWRIEWGTFPGISSQHVKVFLDGYEILNRHYDRPYSLNPHWVELGNCEREETLEQAIWSNLRIGTR